MAPALIGIQASLIILITTIALILYRRHSNSKKSYSVPPGPKPLPVFGNLLDLPPRGEPEFLHWLKHKEIYGPISSVSLMGLTLVIFHDKEAANTVMRKQALKTSARPQMNFATLSGFQNFLVSSQYTEKYRKRRNMVHQEIGTQGPSSFRFQPVQETEALRFTLNILHDPSNLLQHLRTLSAAVILQTTYGYSIDETGSDPLVDIIEHMVKNFSQAFVPFSWLIDIIPAVRYLPDWVPGMVYRKTSQEWKAINDAVTEVPYSFVKRQMANKVHQPSYVSGLLEKINIKAGDNSTSSLDDEDAIKSTAASLYGGASETTVAAVTSVVLALVMFPEVQQRAQEEIDHVVGTNRLPTFEDRENLLYVDSIVKEAWRWNPVIPLGVTHESEEDIVCGEYVVPRGSYLVANIWWFLHDPEVYSDPDIFKPERYLPPLNENDPSQLAFGYGRRSCPGRLFADSIVYITIVQILAAFRFGKHRDAHGNEFSPKLKPVPGIINSPSPFEFNIEPRSSHYVELLNRIEKAQERKVSDVDLLNFNTV